MSSVSVCAGRRNRWFTPAIPTAEHEINLPRAHRSAGQIHRVHDMRNPGPDNTLTHTEIENLGRMETVAERGLRSYREVDEAFAEIRDAQLSRGTHGTFEAYLRERWGIDTTVPVHGESSEAIAKVYEQVLAALEAGEAPVANLRLLPQLRWLLTHSAGSIADVAHQLETNPFEVDDRAREQLRDDVLVIEEELATLRMLLGSVDWDAEFKHLLGEVNSTPDGDAAAAADE